MKKNKIIIIVSAVLLALIIAISGILIAVLNKDTGVGYDGKKDNTSTVAPVDKDDDKGDKGEMNKNNTSVDNSPSRKPIKSNGNYNSIASGEQGKDFSSYTYDIKVTSFNVGGFYHGIDNGMNGDHTDDNIRPWILPNLQEWLGDMARYDADIYGMQEFCPTFFRQASKNINVSSKEAFAGVFKQLETFTGSTASGNQPMYMALAAHSASEYGLTDITTGHLGGKAPATQRAYIKGYTTVNGVKIAVYSVHLGFSDPAATADSISELITLMNKEDYCIVMGDMNTDTIIDRMKKAGFNVANGGDFGLFNTYEYSDSSYIDNIFTTKNIDIKYVECEKDKAGGSDHYPLSAYLKINKEMGSTKLDNPFTDSNNDGFIDGWYKP